MVELTKGGLIASEPELTHEKTARIVRILPSENPRIVKALPAVQRSDNVNNLTEG
jgi:hypothetical protein